MALPRHIRLPDGRLLTVVILQVHSRHPSGAPKDLTMFESEVNVQGSGEFITAHVLDCVLHASPPGPSPSEN